MSAIIKKVRDTIDEKREKTKRRYKTYADVENKRTKLDKSSGQQKRKKDGVKTITQNEKYLRFQMVSCTIHTRHIIPNK